MFKKIVLQTCMLCHVLGMCPKGFMKEERMNYQWRKMFWRPAVRMFSAGCAFILSGPGIGWANTDLPKEPVLPLTLAQKAANAALAKCEEGRYKVSVAVVDRGGNMKVLLRGDGAGPHTQDSSARKAYTASSIRRSTQELAELIIKIPNLQALGDMNERILILGGGLPVVLGNEVVGGIGVGGAPGTQLDEACALAGLTSIGAKPSIQ
jgi:uncharacterized protein GlcG (DUF336 family)